MTSQFSSQPPNENAAYEWTGSQNLTQGQTQYGYNYHHIDQRTENQSPHPACVDTKSNSQQNTTDVYAEFTTDATAMQYGSEQAESYYEPGVGAEYSLHNSGSKFQYLTKGLYGDDSDSVHTSELQCSQYQADGQSQYQSDHAHYQFDGLSFYQSDVQPEREDHARYVPEEYVHFLLERWGFNFAPQHCKFSKLSTNILVFSGIENNTLYVLLIDPSPLQENWISDTGVPS